MKPYLHIVMLLHAYGFFEACETRWMLRHKQVEVDLRKEKPHLLQRRETL
jgi:hypothetical protein